MPKYGEMYIDIGATSKDDALSVVSYGDSVNFNSIYENNGYTIKSKAIDDRFGCLALIELIKANLSMICTLCLPYRKKSDCVEQRLRRTA